MKRSPVRTRLTTISDAKSHLSALIAEVEKGEEVLIGRAGKPVARLVPYRGATSPRQPGALKGRLRIAADFDELPHDLALAFGMKKR